MNNLYRTLAGVSLLVLASSATAQNIVATYEPADAEPALDLGTYQHPAGGKVLTLFGGAGSGSYGEVVAYAVMKGSELSPITLPELTGANAEGYQGHDQFQVVEDCLARRFPIYKPGDSNAKASGGQRQICYKLKAGEAGWLLWPTSVDKF
jgi:hypothetical protein